ncbi:MULTISPECIES: hypothetical protein [unclassified Streptomyces]|uniref:hypothetical protein n=1 Tax=unclassified Streptomyces TaxID=2593676 RepID=UPI00136CAC21|nr:MULTISPECIES: hypothetical protein [unclassified Streptomyces]NDZ98737.1 hypothetical protein [Streptomyces sp. SID10116]MYY83401.1 hypothetical protein [Streptomyces sp. SID335]MYZ15739.1 hypothetical protein [Streptomyces sp. SID337]NDZ84761.1 hypothetical protein [Streptomyces sp. SID10115]NEB43046.1 hypothetical protein [Streptomyces sp. SID339]
MTESKMFFDKRINAWREVDVVVEGELDGEPMIISIEVVERSRRASVTWVQEMLEKHRGLPTNRLILISKSGFASAAIRAVECEAGRVQALTPEMVEINNRVEVRGFNLVTMSYAATGVRVRVQIGENESILIEGEPLIDVYDANGGVLGPLSYLAQDLMNLDAIRVKLLSEARAHAEKEQVKGFSIEAAIGELGYHLMHSESGVLHRIMDVLIWGDSAVSMVKAPLTFSSLGGRVYGSAESQIAGNPAVWVATTNQETRMSRVSWQVTGAPKAEQPFGPTRPLHFHGLLRIFPAPATNDPSNDPSSCDETSNDG